MIGIKLTIGGEELKALFLARAEYHRNKSAHLKMKLEWLDTIEQPAILKDRQKAEIQTDINRHDTYAPQLQIIGENLQSNTQHIIDDYDLEKLGISWRIE